LRVNAHTDDVRRRRRRRRFDVGRVLVLNNPNTDVRRKRRRLNGGRVLVLNTPPAAVLSCSSSSNSSFSFPAFQEGHSELCLWISKLVLAMGGVKLS
jgi:hypothetical protein